MMAWSRSPMERSGSGISAIFASNAASASALLTRRFSAFNSSARSFIAARSSAVKPEDAVRFAVVLFAAFFGVAIVPPGSVSVFVELIVTLSLREYQSQVPIGGGWWRLSRLPPSVWQRGGVEGQPLEGGIANAGKVIRSGPHVLRPATPNSASIHAFLRAVRATGFDGVPSPVGI